MCVLSHLDFDEKVWKVREGDLETATIFLHKVKVHSAAHVVLCVSVHRLFRLVCFVGQTVKTQFVCVCVWCVCVCVCVVCLCVCVCVFVCVWCVCVWGVVWCGVYVRRDVRVWTVV